MANRPAPEYRSLRAADAFPYLNGLGTGPENEAWLDPLRASASFEDRPRCRPAARIASWLPARSQARRLPPRFDTEAVHLAAVHLAIDLSAPRGRHFLGL